MSDKKDYEILGEIHEERKKGMKHITYESMHRQFLGFAESADIYITELKKEIERLKYNK